jgi:hypothetical protein
VCCCQALVDLPEVESFVWLVVLRHGAEKNEPQRYRTEPVPTGTRTSTDYVQVWYVLVQRMTRAHTWYSQLQLIPYSQYISSHCPSSLTCVTCASPRPARHLLVQMKRRPLLSHSIFPHPSLESVSVAFVPDFTATTAPHVALSIRIASTSISSLSICCDSICFCTSAVYCRQPRTKSEDSDSLSNDFHPHRLTCVSIFIAVDLRSSVHSNCFPKTFRSRHCRIGWGGGACFAC